MNEKKIYKIINAVVGTVLCISIIFSVFCARELNSARGLSNEYREQLDRATATVGELTEQLGQCESKLGECQSICGELTDTASRNISTVRDAIEILEELREQIGALQSVAGDFSWDDYYSNLDSSIQEMMEE